MHSRLYPCRVMHCRLAPKRHRFAYGMFLLAVDLDELEALGRRFGPRPARPHRGQSGPSGGSRWSPRALGINRPGLFSFHEKDYLPTGTGGTLKDRVLAYAADHGVAAPGGRVLLLTLPRMFGYVFNPVSFYFVFAADGRPVAAIAEVTNTFREVKPYLVAGRNAAGAFVGRQTKEFYVSPFSAVDVAFAFTLPVPGETLAFRIDDFTGSSRTLISTLTGRGRELTAPRLLSYLVRYPLLTARVMWLIHWHALRLWLKKIPWHPKAARSAEQRPLHARPSRRSGAAPSSPRSAACRTVSSG